MKTLSLGTILGLTQVALASAAPVTQPALVMHYLDCRREITIPDVDTHVVINREHTPQGDQLVAHLGQMSLLGEREVGTWIVQQKKTDPRICGAPLEIYGDGFDLSICATCTPVQGGSHATLVAEVDGRRIVEENLVCRFVR